MKNAPLKIISTTALICTMSINLIVAQTTPTQPLSLCQNVDRFNDFDFWIGDWQVTDTNTGKLAGHNTIIKVAQNCLIQESWVGVAGSGGKSMNYFNPMTGKWRQVWIGSSGYLIDIEGGLVDGDMVLEGTISTFTNHQKFPFKGTWKNLGEGKVQQIFHQFDPKNKKWVLWFDGTYVKQ